MRLYSTKKSAPVVSLQEAVTRGLAPDQGLYMPEYIPVLPESFFKDAPQMSFQEIACTVAGHLLGDEIPTQDLNRIVTDTIQFDAPLIEVEKNIFALELFHGPTLAFKDFGARFLSRMLGYYAGKRSANVTVLVATSGDTGSAVAHGFYNTPGTRVVILYPDGKVSELQEKQFTTLGGNITALKVAGTFDDCQRLVKQAFSDKDLNDAMALASANSINIARLVPQSFYYFYAWSRLSEKQNVVFSVPSGNFGNVCAGHVAKSMGLPMRRLIVATNENDVLDEFFKTGVYQVRDSKHTFETSSPSMDISKASNFERFIFDLLDRNAQETKRLFSQELPRFNRFDLSQHPKFSSIQNQYGFFSGRSSHESRLETIKKAHQVWNNLIDPHTADGLKVALEYRDQDIPMMVLETALPIKFSETIQEALGISPPMPEHLKDLLMKPKRFEVMGADVAEVKRFISNRSTLPSNPH